MIADTRELTYKLLSELGVPDRDPKVAEELEDHFSKVILEVLVRRMPDDKVSELKQKFETDSADLADFTAEIAAGIPGLADELEAALLREYEVLKKMMER